MALKPALVRKYTGRLPPLQIVLAMVYLLATMGATVYLLMSVK